MWRYVEIDSTMMSRLRILYVPITVASDLPRVSTVSHSPLRLCFTVYFYSGSSCVLSRRDRPYGAIFQLTTKIGPTVVHTDYMTGSDVLRCFGFDGGRYWSDLGVLAAVGACGLGLALLFLQRSR